MLTGRSLFAADTVSDTLAGVLRAEIDLDALPATTPSAIRRLLRRCLERNPKNRLRDVGDARIVLDEALAGRGDEPPPAAAVRRAAPGGHRLWLAALPAAAVLGALVAWSLRSAPPAPEPVRVQRLTFSGADYHPSASPDGRFVAFASEREGVARIWLKQMQGGGEQRLTDGPDSNPRFAPDGGSLGFLREASAGRRDLYRTALVGGQPRRLLEQVDDFDWSPDGRSIAFARLVEGSGRADVMQLGVVELESGRERTLVELDGWNLTGIRWRPDGGRIAVTRAAPVGAAGGWRLLLVDPATGAIEELDANPGLGSISRSAWDSRGVGLLYAASPDNVGDLSGAPASIRHLEPGGAPRTLFWAAGLFPFRGSGIAVTTLSILGASGLVFDAAEQVEELREIELPGGTSRQITRSLAVDRQPAYSPDGRRLVFSSNRTGNLDLWLLDRQSGALRQLTDDAAQDWDPGFTPDGRQVLFSSSRSGNLEIWAIDLDGSNARQVSRDGVDAENPTMTPDGGWIVYTSGNADHLGLFRIRPDGSEATQITVGNHTNGEVSPDGRWALFIVAGVGARIHFVEIETGRLAPSRIDVPASVAASNITFGRGRWMRGGRGVAFVGLDERGSTGLFEQDFDPERDTAATRRKLAGFFPDGETESFDVAPDGSAVTIAVARSTRSLMLAEGLPQAPPR
jgi:Tol biopolymer transport system component